MEKFNFNLDILPVKFESIDLAPILYQLDSQNLAVEDVKNAIALVKMSSYAVNHKLMDQHSNDRVLKVPWRRKKISKKYAIKLIIIF